MRSLALALISIGILYALLAFAVLLQKAFFSSNEYGHAQYVAPLFCEKDFFYVRTQDDYRELARTLLENGISAYAVSTYPMTHREVVTPLDVGDGLMVRQIGDHLSEIETGTQKGCESLTG